MNNNKCKRCGSDHYIMNGKVRYNQRYKCKDCGFNFIFAGIMGNREQYACCLFTTTENTNSFTTVRLNFYDYFCPCCYLLLEPQIYNIGRNCKGVARFMENLIGQ